MARKLAIISLVILVSQLQSCAPPREVVSIPFTVVINNEPVVCRTTGGRVQLTDFRMYVSSPQLGNQDGEFVNFGLLADDQWVSRDVAFIDLEDGSAQCLNGTEATNAAMRGTVPEGVYRGLKFTIGVPFELNHQDPLRALAPLGDSAMHWHWRSGYKFLRAGVQTGDTNFFVHLGSAACKGTVQNIEGCDRPNRVEVYLPNFEPGDALQINLDRLFDSFFSAEAVAASCSSGPAEQSCNKVFANLGLDFATGRNAGEQRVFSVIQR